MSDTALLQEQIAGLFNDRLHLEVPSTETDLLTSGFLDSLKFVELLVELEQHFGTRFSLEELDLDSFRSIQRIAQVVAERNGASKSLSTVGASSRDPRPQTIPDSRWEYGG